LISKTGADNITSHYLVVLQGSYRALYLLNWIYRYSEQHYLDPISVVGGGIQVCLSAWAFQRVLATDAAIKGVPMPSLSTKLSQQILFFLRFMQLGATTVNGFIFCYLVWSHNNHICAWWPWRCTDEEKEWATVPWPFIFMITVVRTLATQVADPLIVLYCFLGKLSLRSSGSLLENGAKMLSPHV
jgi:hypothetical protein